MKLSRILWIYAIIILILIASAESIDYTPPGSEDIQLVLESGYSPPLNTEINLVLGDIITEPSLNLSFGPAVDTFRWIGCGPLITNNSAAPEGQTGIVGIDYICNDGDALGNVTVSLSSIPATGWQIYVSNESPYVAVSSAFYRQEFANDTDDNTKQTPKDEDPPTDTNTDLLNTGGSYVFGSGWFDSNIDDFVDGNYSTSIKSFSDATVESIYYKPDNYIDAIIEVKPETGGIFNITNITFACKNYYSDKIRFRISINPSFGGITRFECFDGDWSVFYQTTGDLIYEEAIWWNITEYHSLNISNMENLTEAIEQNKSINLGALDTNECEYVWFGAVCNQVRSNPQAYETYNITG
jgi:hypothetical protein